MPSGREVAQSFRERHELKVLEVWAGDGDNDGNNYLIKYERIRNKTEWASWSVYSSGNLYGWTLLSERMNCHIHTNEFNLSDKVYSITVEYP